MTTILINSPLYMNDEDFPDENSLPSFGLAYIASYAESRGIHCYILDAMKEKIGVDSIIGKLKQIRPQYIGINIFSINMEIVMKIIEKIDFKATIIVGGQVTKYIYNNILSTKTNNIMITVDGDGEYIFSKLITDKNYASYCRKIYNNKFHISIDQNSEFYIKDISTISLNRQFISNEPIKHASKNLSEAYIVTTRGCVHQCAFCLASRHCRTENEIRKRSQENIIQELNDIQNLYGNNVNCVRVLDDLFLSSTKTFETAASLFTNCNFVWRAMTHVKPLVNVNQSYIDDLKKSGCTELEIGVESGSERIQKMIKKNNSINNIKIAFEKVFKANINAKAYFIFGFPSERYEEMEQTYNLAHDLTTLAKESGNSLSLSAFKFRMYIGTELYTKYMETYPDKMIINFNDKKLGIVAKKKNFCQSNGNYSSVSDDELNTFLEKTNNLNKQVKNE